LQNIIDTGHRILVLETNLTNLKGGCCKNGALFPQNLSTKTRHFQIQLCLHVAYIMHSLLWPSKTFA
jgi:hypothetical protein